VWPVERVPKGHGGVVTRIRSWLIAAAAFLIVSAGAAGGVRADGFVAEDGIGFCGVVAPGPGQTSTNVSPQPNNNGWTSGDVTVRASWMVWCSMRTPHTLDFVVSGAESRSGQVDIPAQLGAKRVTGYQWDISREGETTVDFMLKDAAGDPASARQRVTVRIDKTAPRVAVTGVRHGAIYELGAAPVADCTTSDTLSGVADRATAAVTGAAADGTGTLTATCSGGKDIAGNAAPPVRALYTVVPPGSSGATAMVTTDKADYRIGEALTFCFTVPGPGPITITDRLANGQQNVLVEWHDDGRGACFSGTVTPPSGRECLRLDYTGPAGSSSTETCFNVSA
jgi:hypothetical protein